MRLGLRRFGTRQSLDSFGATVGEYGAIASSAIDTSDIIYQAINENRLILFNTVYFVNGILIDTQTDGSWLNRILRATGKYSGGLKKIPYASLSGAEREKAVLKVYNSDGWTNRFDIDDFTFEGNGYADGFNIDAPSEAIYQRIIFHYCRRGLITLGDGAESEGANNVRFTNVQSSRNGIGIHVSGASDIYFDDCILNYGGVGIYLDVHDDRFPYSIHINHGHFEGNEMGVVLLEGNRPTIRDSYFYGGGLVIGENCVGSTVQHYTGLLAAYIVNHGLATRFEDVKWSDYSAGTEANRRQSRSTLNNTIPLEMMRRNILPDGDLDEYGSTSSWTATTATISKVASADQLFQPEVLYIDATSGGYVNSGTASVTAGNHMLCDVVVQTPATAATISIRNAADDSEIESWTLTSRSYTTNPYEIVHRLTPWTVPAGVTGVYVRVTPTSGSWCNVHLAQVFPNMINAGQLNGTTTNITGANATVTQVSGGRTDYYVNVAVTGSNGRVAYSYTKPPVGRWVIPGGWVKDSSDICRAALGTQLTDRDDRTYIGTSQALEDVLEGTGGALPLTDTSTYVRLWDHENNQKLLAGWDWYPFGGVPLKIETGPAGGLCVGEFTSSGTYQIADAFVYDIYPPGLLTGTTANRPDATGLPRHVQYLDTDTDTLYRVDATRTGWA